MAGNLAYSTVRFFIERMESHSCVEQCRQLNDQSEYLFEIERKGGHPPVTVHLSDAYSYGYWEYLSHPPRIRRGDFILIARPEARFDESLVKQARKDGIGIGSIRKLMGALNREKIWQYELPEDRPDSR